MENNLGSMCNTEGEFTITYKGKHNALNYLLYGVSKSARKTSKPRLTVLVLGVLNFEQK